MLNNKHLRFFSFQKSLSPPFNCGRISGSRHASLISLLSAFSFKDPEHFECLLLICGRKLVIVSFSICVASHLIIASDHRLSEWNDHYVNSLADCW